MTELTVPLVGVPVNLVRDTYIETGLYTGESMARMAQEPFRRLCGIEVNREMALSCVGRFTADPRIHVYYGSSTELLRDILEDVPTTCWLDAHYTGWGRELSNPADGECPLLAELEIIFARDWTTPPYVLMDDSFMFEDAFWDTNWAKRFHRPDWPTLAAIIERLPREYLALNLGTILVALPAAEWA